jgi:hypothetical protein
MNVSNVKEALQIVGYSRKRRNTTVATNLSWYDSRDIFSSCAALGFASSHVGSTFLHPILSSRLFHLFVLVILN